MVLSNARIPWGAARKGWLARSLSRGTMIKRVCKLARRSRAAGVAALRHRRACQHSSTNEATMSRAAGTTLWGAHGARGGGFVKASMRAPDHRKMFCRRRGRAHLVPTIALHAERARKQTKGRVSRRVSVRVASERTCGRCSAMACSCAPTVVDGVVADGSCRAREAESLA